MTQTKIQAEDFLKLLEGKDKILFALDYDGTLTPLVPDPDAAILTVEQKQTITKLASHKDVQVAIVTGRGLADLKHLVSQVKTVEGFEPDSSWDSSIILMGTHGSEINQESQDQSYKDTLNDIKAKYSNPDFEHAQYLHFEEKAVSLTIHHRKHPRPQEIIDILHEEARKHEDIFRVQEGHSVFEFLPKDINKGNAIDYLVREYPEYYPIYFGDDLTDNYALRRVREYNGLSIQVSESMKPEYRQAEYLVQSIEEVYIFFNEFMKSRY